MLSHRQLVTRMDTLCRRANEKFGNADQKVIAYGAAHRHGLVVDALDEFAEVEARFVRDVEALKPPAKDRDAFNLYLRGVRRQGVLLAREASFLRRFEHPEKPSSRYDGAYERAYKVRHRAGRELGTDVCGQ